MKKAVHIKWYTGLAGVILIVLTAVFGIMTNLYINKFNKTLLDENQQHLEEISKQISSYIHVVIEDTQNALKTAAGPVYAMGEDRLEAYLHDIASRYGFTFMGYAWQDGMLHSTEETQNVDISGESYFTRCMEGEDVVTGLQRRILTDRAAAGVIIAVPVKAEDGSVRGVLLGLLDMERLNAALEVESFGGEGYSYIIDGEGGLVLHNRSMDYNNFYRVLENVEIESGKTLDGIKKNIAEGIPGMLRYKKFGVDRYAYYMPLGFHSWTVVNIVSKDVVTKKTDVLTKELVVISVSVVVIFMTLLVVCGVSMVNSQNQRHRSEMKSAFLANVSHEIRTPMNVIIGMCELLQRSKLDDRQKKYVRGIKTSGTGLIAVLNDILDMSKIEAGKFTIVEAEYALSDLTEDIAMIAESRIGNKPVSFGMELESGLPDRLIGDKGRIRQILLNLIGNAAKFTDQGSIRLTVGGERTEGQYFLKLCVEDTGIGIQKQEIKNLFVSFSQLDEYRNHDKEGTGLGLAICKALCELMGGEIRAESEYGKGSRFTVKIRQYLPEDRKEGERGKLYEAEDTVTAQYRRARVLLVDDHEMNLEITAALMEPYGMTVDCAGSGKEAVQLIQQNIYDIVFMDHMMPVMDGVETLKEIRKLPGRKYRDLPVIILTANAAKDAEEMFYREGFNGFLAKPVEMAQMDRILKKYLGTVKEDSDEPEK